MPKSKKDISKEAMFSMIMPTGASNHTVAPNVKLARPLDEESSEDNRDAVVSEMKLELTPIEPEEQDMEISGQGDAQDDPDKFEEEFPAEKKPGTDNKKNKPEEHSDGEIHSVHSESMEQSVKTVMVNIREKMVLDKLDEALEKFNCCTCFFCRQDVTAMALNNLQPKYIITTEADIDKIIKSEDSSEVTQAIMKAILYVKTHPRH